MVNLTDCISLRLFFLLLSSGCYPGADSAFRKMNRSDEIEIYDSVKDETVAVVKDRMNLGGIKRILMNSRLDQPCECLHTMHVIFRSGGAKVGKLSYCDHCMIIEGRDDYHLFYKDESLKTYVERMLKRQ